MNSQEIKDIGQRLLSGDLTLETFAQLLHQSTAQSEGFFETSETMVDLDRQNRCGFPEVVYAEGKTAEAIQAIFQVQQERQIPSFATRMSQEKAEKLRAFFPHGVYNPVARTFRLSTFPPFFCGGAEFSLPGTSTTLGTAASLGNAASPVVASDSGAADASSESTEGQSKRRGNVALVTAGTSDLPVAEEARETVLWTGTDVIMIQDVGVAGPHRLRAKLPLILDADAVIVVAGMEGALPSVVGGYVPVPVIAVPTSVGYGASFNGVAALLGMLNSCASNVTVVNIDAGFKAGYVAGLIAKRVALAKNASSDKMME